MSFSVLIGLKWSNSRRVALAAVCALASVYAVFHKLQQEFLFWFTADYCCLVSVQQLFSVCVVIGQVVLCDGVHQWWRPHVSNPACSTF